jgi:cytochrome b subunit of formate dehydrogenase
MNTENRTYSRFDIFQRIEHFILILSFTTLAVTGLIQKYSSVLVSLDIMNFLGGIEGTRIIHRTAATVFLVEAIYHLVVIGYKLFVQRQRASMLPGIRDGLDFVQHFLYNLGLRKNFPKMGRFNFTEKMEYWAMVWGLFLMAVTGFMLWNPILTANILPGQFIPAAKVAHGAEAVLAVLAILLWHFYNVHLKHWNASMFTGKMSQAEMEEEHGAELEFLENEAEPAAPDPLVLKKRRDRYLPAAGLISVMLLFGVYQFVTFEQTAITTIPPAPGAVAEPFSPLTPTVLPTRLPTPTPEPTLPPDQVPLLTWDDGIAELFSAHCGTCHGVMGGFSVDTYRSVMAGGESGPVITPGDAEASLLITAVRDQFHPSRFGSVDLQEIIKWIDSDAPEKTQP